MTSSKWVISAYGLCEALEEGRRLDLSVLSDVAPFLVCGSSADLEHLPHSIERREIENELEFLEFCRAYDGVIFPFGFRRPEVVPVKSVVLLKGEPGKTYWSLADGSGLGLSAEDFRGIALRSDLIVTDSEDLAELLFNNRGNSQGEIRVQPRSAWNHLGLETVRKAHSTSGPGQSVSPAPRFTIVTPSFNQGCFIEETIQSVLNQSYPNFEYVVMDGGSTDETLDILRKYQDRLRWVSENDSGYAEAVNKGFGEASGDYLMWLPSDDVFWDCDVLQKIADVIQSTNADVVYGDAMYTDDVGQLVGYYRIREYSPDELFNWCGICQPATAFRAQSFRDVGGLISTLRSIADYDLWLRLSSSGARFQRAGFIVAKYRLHPGSITTRQKLLTYLEIFDRQMHEKSRVGSSWVRAAVGEMRVTAFGMSSRGYQPPSHGGKKSDSVYSRLRRGIKILIQWDHLLNSRWFQKLVRQMVWVSVRISRKRAEYERLVRERNGVTAK